MVKYAQTLNKFLQRGWPVFLLYEWPAGCAQIGYPKFLAGCLGGMQKNKKSFFVCRGPHESVASHVIPASGTPGRVKAGVPRFLLTLTGRPVGLKRQSTTHSGIPVGISNRVRRSTGLSSEQRRDFEIME